MGLASVSAGRFEELKFGCKKLMDVASIILIN